MTSLTLTRHTPHPQFSHCGILKLAKTRPPPGSTCSIVKTLPRGRVLEGIHFPLRKLKGRLSMNALPRHIMLLPPCGFVLLPNHPGFGSQPTLDTLSECLAALKLP